MAKQRRPAGDAPRAVPGAPASAPPAAPAAIAALFQRALEQFQRGSTANAERLLSGLIERDPFHLDALHLLGLSHLRRKAWASGLALLDRAIAVDDQLAPLHNNRGIALRELGRLDEALASYDRVLTLQPDHADAHNNRGNVLRDLQRFAEALGAYDRSLALKPANPPAFNNRGLVLRELGRTADALNSLERAIGLNPEYVEAHVNRAGLLLELRRAEEALAACDQALRLDPGHLGALKGRGRAFEALQRLDEARDCHARVLARAPNDPEALNNLGSVLEELQRADEALACYDRALAAAPDSVPVLANRAALLMRGKRYEEATRDLGRVLQLQPGHPYALGDRLFCRMHACDWTNHASEVQGVDAAIDAGQQAALPFSTVAFCADPARQLVCARAFAKDQHPLDALPGGWSPAGSGRIRLAYVSADFHDHATAHLMIDLFETHDRARFEVWGVSLGPDHPSPMRDRVMGSFEHVVDARQLGDRELAGVLRRLGIDIAIDLKGYTRGSRPDLFAHRAAPIQVSYLGYPGTMGHPAIDYLIADETVVPPGHEAHYSEQVVRLPNCYQVNARSRRAADHTPSRADCGLPEHGFVFCSFNNNYKITPDVFDIWMRLLQAVEGSVLWLLEDNPAASRNLRDEAGRRGIDPARLVFAARLPLPDHLARHRVADLFLDTLPCNAHTTASDALWAGLPLVTCLGSTFAGRVAASALYAVGLPELVAQDLQAYEDLALALARDPQRLAGLRSRLAALAPACALFDTDRFRRHLEQAYLTMAARRAEGLDPLGFTVDLTP